MTNDAAKSCSPLTFGSLFCGIGGIDLGFERAGLRCAWQVEIDDYATRVLEKHWPDTLRFRDVRECGAHNLPYVDVVTGGFPCQDISNAGKRAGIGGERSGLWFEYARIVREIRPRYVVVENVAALLGRGIDTVLGDLSALGFDAEWHCIPAAAVGASHIRDRVFILAYAAGGRLARQSEGDENARMGLACGRQGFPGAAAVEDMADADCKPVVRFAVSRPERDSWAIEPVMDRVAYGIPDQLDRLRCLGNAVVPLAAEYVGGLIVRHAANATAGSR